MQYNLQLMRHSLWQWGVGGVEAVASEDNREYIMLVCDFPMFLVETYCSNSKMEKN